MGSDGEGNSTVYPAIQTDAAINPGNSGGRSSTSTATWSASTPRSATAGASTGGESGSIGLGFAIPMDEVMPIVDQMAKGETPTHARLGVSVSNVGATENGQPGGQPGAEVGDGAQIQEVNAGSTAADAGIATGDVITKVDDHLITDADSLVATIRSYRPGDTVTVTYEHAGATKTAELTLDSDSEASNS